MADIIYFGTNGSYAGHYPIGIDKELTSEEYKYWCNIDNDRWICAVVAHPGFGHLTHNGEIVYTCYSQPWSVDDKRAGCHTNLFWKGEHSEEEIINLIKSNSFLVRQFKLSPK